MIRVGLREILIFLVILVVMSFVMHGGDIFERFAKAMEKNSIFYHSLLYTLLFYFLLLIPRFIIKLILIQRNKKRIKNEKNI